MTMQAEIRVHVAEGETRIESDAHLVLTTILGSCVAACIFDRTARTGGMNHFLLSGEGGTGAGAAERYGAFLMEVLVNGLLARGAKRGRLEAKLFGGSRMAAASGDIDQANATFAKDGEEALKMMMSSPAHIVISDYNMPKLNGLQLLQAIRTFPATRITPFILLTGSGDRTVLQQAVKLGVNNYLPKPVQPAALQKAIQAVTGNLP